MDIVAATTIYGRKSMALGAEKCGGNVFWQKKYGQLLRATIGSNAILRRLKDSKRAAVARHNLEPWGHGTFRLCPEVIVAKNIIY